jgi:hypothetical protein
MTLRSNENFSPEEQCARSITDGQERGSVVQGAHEAGMGHEERQHDGSGKYMEKARRHEGSRNINTGLCITMMSE